MSVKIMAQVWECSRARLGELLVLLAIADFADDDGIAYPTVELLSRKTRLSERETYYVLQTLRGKGELSIDYRKGPKRANRYTVLLSQRRLFTESTGQSEGARIAPCLDLPLQPNGEKGPNEPQAVVGAILAGCNLPDPFPSPPLTLPSSLLSPSPTRQKMGDPDKRDHPPSPKAENSRVQLADEEFITALKQNPAYEGIDIDRLVNKLKAWQLTPKGRGKLITRQRLLNCLNKEERAMVLPENRPCEWQQGLQSRCDRNAAAGSKYCELHRDYLRKIQDQHKKRPSRGNLDPPVEKTG